MKSPIKISQTATQSTSLVRLVLAVVTSCISYTNNSFAAKGDELVVIESLVNVRAEPSLKAESVLKLKKDRKVTEIRRQDNWVEIDTHREDIQTGWIHKSLLDKSTQSHDASRPTRFDTFKQRFNDRNEVIKKQNGVIYFTQVTDKGNFEIQLVATQAWIKSTMETRNNTLSEVFKMWSDVVPVGSSISVYVVDDQGEHYTVMLR